MDAGNIPLTFQLNNKIFRCVVCGKFYNLEKNKAFVILVANGFTPNGTDGMGLNLNPAILCESCRNENDGDKGMELKEPSKIVTATPNIDVNKIKMNKKMTN